MKLALGFTLHGRPTTLKFCALGQGITTPANDLATSGSQRQFHINSVNTAPHLCHT
jgi:hypothetical protein